MRAHVRRLNNLVRRAEQKVAEARQATQGERFRLALNTYEESGFTKLPDDPEARKWCLLLDQAKAEFEALHTIAAGQEGYVNPAFAGGQNEQ